MKQIGIVPPMGEGGGVVEMDETYFGRKMATTPRAGSGHKYALVSLVERGGKVRSFQVDRVSRKNAEAIVAANVSREARLMTDKAQYYKRADFDVAEHKMIDHSIGQYRKGDCYTNTIESYYSTFKRGMKGTYQHCEEKHFHRYAAEFDFRYNNRIALGIDDVARTEALVRGIVGKRLTYR